MSSPGVPSEQFPFFFIRRCRGWAFRASGWGRLGGAGRLAGSVRPIRNLAWALGFWPGLSVPSLYTLAIMLNHLVTAAVVWAASLVSTGDPSVRLVTDRVDAARLMETLAALPAKRSPGASEEHVAGLRRTEEMLVERLKEMGYEPQLQEVPYAAFRRDAAVWHNIIAEIPGRARPHEVLIVGAHLDAVPVAPGADDNGTGVAALLEIARVLKDEPMERTVRMIFFTLEEVGLVGSSHYARELGPRIRAGEETVVGMISMDMLGFYSDEAGSQTWPALPVRIPLPTTADFIAVGGIIKHQPFSRPLIEAMREGAGEGVKIFAGDLLPIAVPDFLRSDHAPFLSMNIPAVLVSDTANFRSKHYHKATDTVETIDRERFAATVKGLVNGVYQLARPVGSARPDPLTPPPGDGAETPAQPRGPRPPAPGDPEIDPRSPVAPRPAEGEPGREPGRGPEMPR